MYRTHDCGSLRITDVGEEVKLSGWVQAQRKFGGLIFVDLRDRYGITQLVFDENDNPSLCEAAERLGREYVICAAGKVRERSNKNPNRPTGDIEITVDDLRILNTSKVPPFTIEDESDGGDELRMKYRYLDLRRNPVQEKNNFSQQGGIRNQELSDSTSFRRSRNAVPDQEYPRGCP